MFPFACTQSGLESGLRVINFGVLVWEIVGSAPQQQHCTAVDLLFSSLLSPLSSSLAFLSCLLLTFFVLSLSSSVFSSLSFSVFFFCLLPLSLSLSPCVVVVVVVVSCVCVSLWSWCVRVVWCGTLKTRVCTFKSPRVYRHHARKCYHIRAWCRYTRRRFECTRVGVLNVHTVRGVGVWEVKRGQRDTHTNTNTQCTTNTHANTQHRIRKVSSPVLLTKIWPRRVTTWPQRFKKRNPWILHVFCLTIDREQHVPDSSNHSLYLTKLLSFSNLEGNFGGNQLPDGSIGLSPSVREVKEFRVSSLSSAAEQRRFAMTIV